MKARQAGITFVLALCVLSGVARGEMGEPSATHIDWLYTALAAWDRGEPWAADHFETVRRDVERSAGTLSPLGPRVAQLILTTSHNQYELAYLLAGVEVRPKDASTRAVVTAARSSQTDAGRLVAIAKLGHLRSVESVAAAAELASNPDSTVALMATVTLGFAIRTNENATAGVPGVVVSGLSDSAVLALVSNIAHQRRDVRIAAVNSLRLRARDLQYMSPETRARVGSALSEYLAKQEAVSLTVRALENMPADVAAFSIAQLETLAEDPLKGLPLLGGRAILDALASLPDKTRTQRTAKAILNRPDVQSAKAARLASSSSAQGRPVQQESLPNEKIDEKTGRAMWDWLVYSKVMESKCNLPKDFAWNLELLGMITAQVAPKLSPAELREISTAGEARADAALANDRGAACSAATRALMTNDHPLGRLARERR